MISALLAWFSYTLLLVSIAILIVLLLAFLVIVLWRTRKKRVAPEQTASTPAGAEESGNVPVSKTQTYANDEKAARASVSAAVQLVAENSAGMGGRYRSPWFLVVGAVGSGKSTMLDRCRIPQTWHQGTVDFGVSQGIHWRFFDGGVVLDVPGDCFLDYDKTSSNEGKWNSLLRNLVRYRPQRPLDGVVLTIPCTELMGDAAISPAALGQRADLIASKLWQIQKWTGFTVPVYVLVTKCDQIPGFQSLSACLPPEYQDQMFGWSSPYNLEAAFSSSWIDEGFDQLAPEIQALQAEVLVARPDLEDPDDLFLFSGKFQELRKPLRLYLKQIFKQSVYRESLQFRGFYFCGDIAAVSDEPQPAQAMASAASASGFSSPEYVSGEGLHLSTALEPSLERSPVFITDLFREKIFPERGLARPVTTIRWSRNRVVLGAQVACAIAIVVLTIGVSLRYRALSRRSNHVSEPLSRIYDNMASRNSDPEPLSDGTDPAYDPITIVENVGGHKFQSIFLPTSYLTPMETDVEDAMVPAFDRLVYTSMKSKIESELNKLAQSSQIEGDIPSDIDSATLSNHRSFKQLSQFVDDLVRAEDNVDLYFSVAQERSGNAKDLDILAAALQEHTPPLITNREALDAIINKAGWPQNQVATARDQLLKNYRGGIVDNLQSITGTLGKEWISDNPILKHLDKVKADLDKLNDSKLETYEELNDLSSSLTKAKDRLSRPDFAWMSGQEMIWPELLKTKLDQVFERPAKQNILCESSDNNSAKQNNASFIGGESKGPVCRLLAKTQIENIFQKDFENFKTELLAKKTAMFGQLIVLNAGSLQLAPGAEKTKALLDTFMKLPFVMDEGGGQIQVSLPTGVQLMWDKDQLQTALEYKKSFDDFLNGEAGAATPNIEQAFKEVGLDHLDANLNHLIARAQKFQPLPASTDPAQLIEPELQSFQDAAGSLNTLLGYLQEMRCDETYNALRQITTLQAKNLLARIDSSFDGSSPYGAGAEFSRWSGNTTPAQAGLDLRTPADTDEYLKEERITVQKYAAYAKPVLDFLDAHAARTEAPVKRLKWRGIVNAKSDAKVPGKSLAALEDFIQNDIDKANPEDCQADFLAKAGPAGGDYFVTARESLRQALLQQCQVLAKDNAWRDYRNLASFFNEYLAGRFPFAVENTEQSSEADPQDILQFYQLDDGRSRSIAAGLKAGAFADGDQKRGVDTFLKQIKALKPLFALTPNAQPDALPAFDFVPVFRVNTAHEINGNQIIDWTLQVGADTFRNQDPQRVGRWTYGDPVKLILRWAKDSPAQPASVGGNARIVNGKGVGGSPVHSVVFEFRDSWALLSMINQHQAQANDFDRRTDPDPQTLVFTINDTNTSSNEPGGEGIPQTKVFIRLKLRPAGKPENLRLAVFPTHAPLPTQESTQAGNTGGGK